MSEATAVVEEVKTPTKELTPPVVADSPDIAPSGAEQKQETGVPAVLPGTEGPTGTDGVDDGEPDPEALAQAALTEAMGGKPAAPPKPSEAPGLSLEEYQAGLNQRRASQHAQLRQGADMGIVQGLQGLGLSDAEAKQAWETIVRPHFNAALVDNDAYQTALDNWVIDQLPDSQKQAFKSRVYRDRKERTEGLIALGSQETEDKYKADIEAGKFLDRKIADKAAVDAARSAIAARDKQYNARGMFLAKSGNEVNGTGGVGRSEDEILLDPTTPISTINEILARRNGQ